MAHERLCIRQASRSSSASPQGAGRRGGDPRLRRLRVCFEGDPRVASVAEGLVVRVTAAAEREPLLGMGKGISRRVHELDVALDPVGAIRVHRDFYVCQGILRYMPMPRISAPGASVSPFGRSAIIASVVSISAATEAALTSAVRTTFVGSMTPAFTRSSYAPVAALKPNAFSFDSFTLFTTMLPSTPLFSAI